MSTESAAISSGQDAMAAWTKYLEEGKELYSQGQMQESAVIFNQLIAANTYVAESWYGLGLIRVAAGDLQGANSDVTRSLQYNPRNANAYFVLGVIAERLGSWDNARAYYTQALAIDSGLAGAQERLTQVTAILAAAGRQVQAAPIMGAPTARQARRTRPWGGCLLFLLVTAVAGAAVVLASNQTSTVNNILHQLNIGSSTINSGSGAIYVGFIATCIAIVALFWLLVGLRLAWGILWGTPRS